MRRLELWQAKTAPAIDELNQEVLGPPRDPERRTVRTRLHDLEQSEIAERAAEAVLEAGKAALAAGKDATAAAHDRRIALWISAGTLLATVALNTVLK